VVVLAGCDDGDGDGGPGTAPTSSSETPDADVELVAGVVAELVRAQQVASSAGDTDLVALHGAHLEALEATSVTSPVPGTFGAADVQQRERRLQTHLVGAAVDAQSGALAALLASMGAAVSQRLAAR
jgi:hypothetical protein